MAYKYNELQVSYAIQKLNYKVSCKTPFFLKMYIFCHNLSLGLATKARACKVVGQEGSPGVKENVREWTLTLPKELPLWEVESSWSPGGVSNVHKMIARVKTQWIEEFFIPLKIYWNKDV